MPFSGTRLNDDLEVWLARRVYPVPDELDRNGAKMKLESLVVKIDQPAPDQEHYPRNWPKT